MTRGSDPWSVLTAYGVDPDVLYEYRMIPLRARLVRDMVKLRTEFGVRALKKVHMDARRLQWVHQCTEHIAKNRFPNVPRFVRTIYGDPFVNHPTGQYYVTAWWSGKELDAQSAEEFMDGLRVLANWHLSARGASSTEGFEPNQASFVTRMRRVREDLARYCQLTEAHSDMTPFQRLFRASFEGLIHRVDTALQVLDETQFAQVDAQARVDGWICHGDFTRHNVTFDGVNYTVWNYDKVYRGAPAMDIALYLHRYMPAFDWTSDVLATAVRTYQDEIADELSADALSGLLALPLRSLQVVSWYFQKSRDWDEDDFVDALEVSLDLDNQRAIAVQEVFSGPVEIPVLTMSDSDGAGAVAMTPEKTELPFGPETRGELTSEIGDGSSHRPAELPVTLATDESDAPIDEMDDTTTEDTAPPAERKPARASGKSKRKTPQSGKGAKAASKQGASGRQKAGSQSPKMFHRTTPSNTAPPGPTP